MPQNIHIFSCEENLAQKIARRLAEKETPNLSRTALIVPSRRMKNEVRAAIAEAIEICFPPRIYTLASFAKTLPASTYHKRISRLEQKLIVSALLLEGEYQHFREGQSNDLMRFFNELAEAGLNEGAFPQIKAFYEKDVFRHESHIAKLVGHVDELERLYKGYVRFLDAHDLTDPYLDFFHRLDELEQNSDWTALADLERLFLIGFSDASAMQAALFRKMLHDERVELWLQADTALKAHKKGELVLTKPFSPLDNLLKKLGVAKSEIAFASGNQTVSTTTIALRRAFGHEFIGHAEVLAPVTIHAANSPFAEAKAIASLCRKLIQYDRIEPHKILVTVPNETLYGKMLRSVFAQTRIPANPMLHFRVGDSICGQLLRLFLDLARYDWRLPDLLSLLINPFVDHWLRAAQFPETGIELQRLLQKFAVTHDLHAGAFRFMETAKNPEKARNSGRGTYAPKSPEAPRLLDFFKFLQKTLAVFDLKSGHDLTHWIEKLSSLIQALALEPAVMEKSGEAYEIEMLALQKIYQARQQLTRMGKLLDTMLEFPEFCVLLNQNLFSAMFRPDGQPQVGVQIMGLQEALGVPAEVLIIPGNTEGNFPKAVERELFLPERLRLQLGLQTFRGREELQDQLFFQLAAPARAVHLFYPRFINEMPTVRSRYLQRLEVLRITGFKSILTTEEEGLALRGELMINPAIRARRKSLERTFFRLEKAAKRRLDERGRFEGNRAALFGKMSASTMEDLLYCPYRYLFRRLSFSHKELPDGSADNRHVGLWLHTVGEIFFKGLSEAREAELRDPWRNGIDEATQDKALHRLRRLSRILLDRGRPHLDYLYHMHYIGWPKFLQREIVRQSGWFERESYEFWPEEDEHRQVETQALTIAIDGRVDRLAVMDDRVHVIDYKLRRPGVQINAIEKGKAPQLPLYVHLLRKQRPDLAEKDWAGEYYPFWDGDRIEFKDQPAKPRLTEAWENLMKNLEARLEEHFEKNEPLDAIEDKQKCTWCDFNGVCRRQEEFYRG